MNHTPGLWKKMWSLWQESEVPPVRIIDFRFGKDIIQWPWYSLAQNKQVGYVNTPMQSTAYHLCSYLKDKDQELIAAYKIHAFLVANHMAEFPYHDLDHAMKKHGENLHGWWSPNSIHVLPYVQKDDYWVRARPYTNRMWREVVTRAATEWQAISQEWAVIRIPKFMDTDSPEYREIAEHSRKLHEEREHQEYLRLKKKFEQKG
ncbi:MAG: hypothetical protein JST38_09790 [Bacteroidetes bacterium]|nr:hypothetical protein [Bacteroidota bacterium]